MGADRAPEFPHRWTAACVSDHQPGQGALRGLCPAFLVLLVMRFLLPQRGRSGNPSNVANPISYLCRSQRSRHLHRGQSRREGPRHSAGASVSASAPSKQGGATPATLALGWGGRGPRPGASESGTRGAAALGPAPVNAADLPCSRHHFISKPSTSPRPPSESNPSCSTPPLRPPPPPSPPFRAPPARGTRVETDVEPNQQLSLQNSSFSKFSPPPTHSRSVPKPNTCTAPPRP